MPPVKKTERDDSTAKRLSRSENMRRITGKNTTPEVIVRRLLSQHGFRYRLHRADLPGKPDIVFMSRRKVIFVHGCFWHAHSCRMAHKPRTNQGYWSPKLQGNQERDARHLSALKAAGWKVHTIWECELKDVRWVERKVLRFLNGTKEHGSAKNRCKV
jgi:DNA mismatch endonuclease (patch repair protein)